MVQIKGILELIPKNYRFFALIILVIFAALINFFYKKSKELTKTKISIKGDEDQVISGEGNTIIKGNNNSIKLKERNDNGKS